MGAALDSKMGWMNVTKDLGHSDKQTNFLEARDRCKGFLNKQGHNGIA